MDISVIVPAFNERESLPELCSRIHNVMHEHGYSYEVIIVDDGSTDGSWDCISDISKKDNSVHGIRFRRNYGKSGALYCGFKRAEGNVVITMDADLQDFPEEIPELYRMITEQGYDLVSGWKQHRQDNALTKNLPSKLYNATARRITGIKLHDMNCGLKAYRKEVVKNIEVYGEMHRYIPYQACASVPRSEIPASHRPATFLPRTARRHPRRNAFPCRVYRRDDSSVLWRAQPIQHPRRNITASLFLCLSMGGAER